MTVKDVYQFMLDATSLEIPEGTNIVLKVDVEETEDFWREGNRSEGRLLLEEWESERERGLYSKEMAGVKFYLRFTYLEKADAH